MSKPYFPFSITNLYICSFIISFIVGGVSGIVCSFSTIDILIHDTMYIVGHFHYVLLAYIEELNGSSLCNWGFILTSMLIHLLIYINFKRRLTSS